MSTTSLRLDGSFISSLFHKFFGSKRLEDDDYDVKKKGLGQNFFSSKDTKGYVIIDPDADGTENKEYWVENLDDKVILTTALMAHGELGSDKNKIAGGYQTNFNLAEIKRLVETLRATEEYKNKPIHIIIPRVETGAIENHIVVEYHEIAADGSSNQCMVIDSKPWPSGIKHDDFANRIHTEKQGFFNSEDCGYHVNQTMPALRDMITKGTPINSKTLLSTLDKKNEKGASYATRVAIDKLHRLASLYENRVNADRMNAARGIKEKLHEHLLTFGLFRFGCGATAKLGATTKILANIEAKETDIFKGLSKEEIEAANDSTLGKVVDEYQNSVMNSFARFFSLVCRIV